MNIYQRIRSDHEEHRKLAARIAETSGDSKERRDLFAQFRKEVTAHADAEEQTFYAELISKPEGQDEARHGIVEHHDVDDLFKEFEDVDPASSGWMNKFHKLQHELEHHMEEEEQDIFPKAKKLIDDARAAELTKEFETRKSAEISA